MFKKILLTLTTYFILAAMASVSHAADIDCTMCHSNLTEGKTKHAALSMGCTTCHSGVNAADIPHKFKGTRGLMAEGADLCFNCHDSKKFSSDKETVHVPVSAGMCTSCHNPHSTDNEKLLLKPIKDLCNDCHDKSEFYGPTIHPPVAEGQCTLCHSPHKSPNQRLLTSPVKDLCTMCHSGDDFNRKNRHKPVAEGQCTECHLPHASQNESLLFRRGNMLCRKCHSEIEKNPHTIAGFSQPGHPTSGRRDPLRRTKTFGCDSCHQPHSSDWPYMFRYEGQSAFDLCGKCHKSVM